jgi:hypothetical protein
MTVVLLTLITEAMGIVAGLLPQLKVIEPPEATAASNAACVQLAAEPLPTTWLVEGKGMGVGRVQTWGGVAVSTGTLGRVIVSGTDAVKVVLEFVGVKVAVSVCVPTPRYANAAGEYVNEPGSLAVAFNWALLNPVPYGMGAGVAQVITGAAWLTVRATKVVVTW